MAKRRCARVLMKACRVLTRAGRALSLLCARVPPFLQGGRKFQSATRRASPGSVPTGTVTRTPRQRDSEQGGTLDVASKGLACQPAQERLG